MSENEMDGESRWSLAGLARKFKSSVGAQILASLIVAGVFFVCCWLSGRADDCKPHDIDGQCGLSTFVGALYGFIGAIAIVLLSGIAIGVREWRRR
ncbi:MAG: hypothetical protein M3R43_06160 [Acidobacteriota bacterium]|nr:hypothetical protein [Acidobacteriota bacterium]